MALKQGRRRPGYALNKTHSTTAYLLRQNSAAGTPTMPALLALLLLLLALPA